MQMETDSSSADSGIHTAAMPSPIYYAPSELFTQEPKIYFNLLTKNRDASLEETSDLLNLYAAQPDDDQDSELSFQTRAKDNRIKDFNDDTSSDSLLDFHFQPTCLSRITSLEAHELSLSDSPSKRQPSFSKSLLLLEKMKMGLNDDQNKVEMRNLDDKKQNKNLKDLKRAKQLDNVLVNHDFTRSNYLKGINMSFFNLSEEEINILKMISIENLLVNNIKAQLPKDMENHRRSFKDLFYWRRSQPDSLQLDNNEANQQINKRIFGVSLATCIKNEQLSQKLNNNYEFECESLFSKMNIQATQNWNNIHKLKCPKFVLTCCVYLLNNGLNQVGLFRINGSRTRIEELKKQINLNGELLLDPSSNNIHDIACLLKEFFRELPTPLISRELYAPLIASTELLDENNKLRSLKAIIALLPSHHRDTLFVLLLLLYNVSNSADAKEGSSGNKMDANNLATIFATNILRTFKKMTRIADDNDLEQHASIIAAISLLIQKCNVLFQVDEDIYSKILSKKSKERNFRENCCQTDPTFVSTRPMRPHSTLPEYSKDLKSISNLNNKTNHSFQSNYMQNKGDVLDANTDRCSSLHRNEIGKHQSYCSTDKFQIDRYSKQYPEGLNISLELYNKRLSFLQNEHSSTPCKHIYNSQYNISGHQPSSNFSFNSYTSPFYNQNNNILNSNDIIQTKNKYETTAGNKKSWSEDRWQQWQRETELHSKLTGQLQTLV